MTEMTPKHQRLLTVKDLVADADRQMAAANHKTLKAEVTLAIRDLQEATHYLEAENIDERPAMMEIVDLLVQLAGRRLTMVQDAIQKYGPDAMLVQAR